MEGGRAESEGVLALAQSVCEQAPLFSMLALAARGAKARPATSTRRSGLAADSFKGRDCAHFLVRAGGLDRLEFLRETSREL